VPPPLGSSKLRQGDAKSCREPGLGRRGLRAANPDGDRLRLRIGIGDQLELLAAEHDLCFTDTADRVGARG
jgi:hypothetical protein